MVQAMSHGGNTGAQRRLFSPWMLGSFLATAVLIYTTFAKVIKVPIVSNYVSGTLFEITSYVRGLTTLYAPWLSKMMAESAGTGTANLLRLGSAALVAAEIIAIAAIAAAVLHLLLAFAGKVRASRRLGIAGFALGLVVPVLMFAVAAVVSRQMASDVLSLNVVSVPLGPRLQLAACVLGIVCVCMAQRRRPE